MRPFVNFPLDLLRYRGLVSENEFVLSQFKNPDILLFYATIGHILKDGTFDVRGICAASQSILQEDHPSRKRSGRIAADHRARHCPVFGDSSSEYPGNNHGRDFKQRDSDADVGRLLAKRNRHEQGEYQMAHEHFSLSYARSSTNIHLWLKNIPGDENRWGFQTFTEMTS
jgi:hypothetical protein